MTLYTFPTAPFFGRFHISLHPPAMPRKRRKTAPPTSRLRRSRGGGTAASEPLSQAANLLNLPVDALRTIIEMAWQGWEEDLAAVLERGCKEKGEEDGEGDELAAAKRRAPTIESTLAWSHSIISHTPNLLNLSLTGHLTCVTVSPRLNLAPIRKLSIGPTPAFLPNRLKISRFAPNVEELRVCGEMLSGDEREDVTAGLRTLKRLEWSLVGRVKTKE